MMSCSDLDDKEKILTVSRILLFYACSLFNIFYEHNFSAVRGFFKRDVIHKAFH